MTNLASAIKTETARLARKEIRREVQSLRKTAAHYRSDIAALKRRIQTLEQQVKRVAKGLPGRRPAVVVDDGQPAALRFSAKGFASQRRRLGLSAAQTGMLLGVSDQSVYKWEEGRARPRARHLPAIAALRTPSKKQAATHLETLR